MPLYQYIKKLENMTLSACYEKKAKSCYYGNRPSVMSRLALMPLQGLWQHPMPDVRATVPISLEAASHPYFCQLANM